MRKFIPLSLLVVAIGFGLLGWLESPIQAQDSKPEEPDKTTESAAKAPRTEAELTGYIDSELAKVWKRDGITPAKRSNDEEFVRRVYLDTIGLPPDYAEVTSFLADKRKDKRERLIDKLVNDRRFGEHMSNQWTHTLVPRTPEATSGSALFAQWMADEFNRNKGFDRTIRQIVTAKGSLTDTPAIVPWFKDGQGARIGDMIGKLSKGLMGVQVQCAQCHDHPYEGLLTQKSFQGLAAFLSATQARVDNGVQPARAYVTQDANQPKRIEDAYKKLDTLNAEQRERVKEYINYVRPVTLDGVEIDRSNPLLWRAKLSAWMLSNKNPRTSRYVANRMWSIAFGSGIVNPIDDFNAFNEPTHPELLNTIANDLLNNSWDMKRVYRSLLSTKAYQLSSKHAPENAETWHFASYPVRQLSPEQFIGSLLRLMSDKNINKVTEQHRDVPLAQARTRLVRAKKAQADGKLPANQRKVRYDIKGLDVYIDKFKNINNRWWVSRWAAGNYTRTTTDDEMNQQDSFVLTIDQALTVMNGAFTNGLSGRAEGSLLYRIGKAFSDNKSRVRAMYLVVVGRAPTEVESKLAVKYMKDAKDEGLASEDLLYALMMTTEFATNH
ncbi:MAG: DUF1549 and DUF1553 domain-containing protein [Planctomycetes bacterium]|nr:DUF1549 and DUF1553 domain-containing protein [Planctomycetota bacterium]